MREDELGLKLDRLDIILGSRLVLASDEEDLTTMKSKIKKKKIENVLELSKRKSCAHISEKSVK